MCTLDNLVTGILYTVTAVIQFKTRSFSYSPWNLIKNLLLKENFTTTVLNFSEICQKILPFPYPLTHISPSQPHQPERTPPNTPKPALLMYKGLIQRVIITNGLVHGESTLFLEYIDSYVLSIWFLFLSFDLKKPKTKKQDF